MAQPPNRLPTPAPGAFEYAAIIPHAPLYNNNPGAGGPTITIPHLPNVYAQYLPMSGPVVDGPDMTIRLQQAMNWLGAANSANETILRHVGLIVSVLERLVEGF